MTTYIAKTPEDAYTLLKSGCIPMGFNGDGYEYMCNPNEDVKDFDDIWK